MIKLDLNKKICVPTGEESKETMAEIVANKLFVLTDEKDPIKINNLALRIYEEQSIEIDISDFDMLKQHIEKDKSFFVFAKAQILETFNEAKEKALSDNKKPS